MESWSLSSSEVHSNIEKVQALLKSDEGFYIPSSDSFLSEYVPLKDCFRYYVSGFTGSTAELLITKDEVLLYLDGRYHEQGEKEKHPLVTPVNVDFGSTLKESLLGTITNKQLSLLYYPAERTPFGLHEQFAKQVKTSAFSQTELGKIIDHQFAPKLAAPYLVDIKSVGLSSKEKLAKLFAEKDATAFFICSLDQVAWLTNTRGFHAPCQSFFNAKAFVTATKIYLFSDMNYEWSAECNQDGVVEMHSFEQLDEILKNVSKREEIKTIYFSDQAMTMENYASLNRLAPLGVELEAGSVLDQQMRKNHVEISEMQTNFMSSNHAIVNSLRWVQSAVKHENVSELDFYNKVNNFYKEAGASCQSFNTIAAVDENSSVMHFGDSSADKNIEDNSIILLDSGAHYRSGFATDTTRTICVGSKPHEDFIKYYTLVLQGLLKAEMALFPSGTLGSQIDALARETMRLEGLDFAHGTGHGVGVNVHEGGFSISPRSAKPLYESMVGSIEPGLYFSGFGGIRLENIAVIRKHAKFKDMLCFETMTYIGYDFNLIDLQRLSIKETEYLVAYEQKCEKLGTSFNWSKSTLYKK